jgi:hypothetical protein
MEGGDPDAYRYMETLAESPVGSRQGVASIYFT